MILLELAEYYNRLIRKEDYTRTMKCPPDDDIIIYNTEPNKVQLQRLLSSYQDKVNLNQPLQLDEIGELARTIVIEQKFCDGNHRTALFLCYHLALHCNSQLLKISPYLLYAAIDFEYLKSIYYLPEDLGKFFKNNAITTAFTSRAISNIPATKTMKLILKKIESEIISMPTFIESLSSQLMLPNHRPSITTQSKLFRQFLGFRPTMSHSTKTSTGQYTSWLRYKKLLDTEFNPKLDLNNPHKPPRNTRPNSIWKGSF
jgi:hypothetical protein